MLQPDLIMSQPCPLFTTQGTLICPWTDAPAKTPPDWVDLGPPGKGSSQEPCIPWSQLSLPLTEEEGSRSRSPAARSTPSRTSLPSTAPSTPRAPLPKRRLRRKQWCEECPPPPRIEPTASVTVDEVSVGTTHRLERVCVQDVLESSVRRRW